MKNLFNKINRKMIAISAMSVTALSGTAFAKGANLDGVVAPIVALINSLMGPALALVTAIGSLYCVLLGVKFAKAEEPQEREKAKAHLKNAIIGFVLIFVLILALNLSKDPLIAWMEKNHVNVT
jgi:cytochrome bd-type quinol oxidase subunit 2